MSNKSAKAKLIELYGPECFIEKLHLRKDTEPRHYTSKGQIKKMKQLTYHHIREKRNGGKSTLENGALLSVENHEWFNKQSPEVQAELNRRFQEYKKCKVIFTDNLNLDFNVKMMPFSIDERGQIKKYNRAKEKESTRKIIEEEIGEEFK